MKGAARAKLPSVKYILTYTIECCQYFFAKFFNEFASFFQLIWKGKTSQISAETVTASRERGRKTAWNRNKENKRPSD